MDAIETRTTTTPGVVDPRVDDAGRDSFPASDPPTWWAGADRLPRGSEKRATR